MSKIILGILSATLVLGLACQTPKTVHEERAATTQATKRITYPDGSVYEDFTNYSENNNLTDTTSDKGSITSKGFTWDVQAVDWAKKNTWVYYLASILCGLGVVACIYFKLPGAAIPLGILGAVFMFAPVLIPILGVWIAILIGICITAAVAWIVAKYIFHVRLQAKAVPAIAKLQQEGKHDEAVAIARTVNPKLDAEYRK